MKQGTKPKTYSVSHIYDFYVKNLLKDNPYYYVTKTKEVYCSISKELNYVIARIELKKSEYEELDNKLIDGRTNRIQIKNELSDLKASMNSFEKRKQELIKDTKDRKKIIDYKKFKEVLTVYNTKAGEKIIKGDRLNLLNNLGYIGGKRVQRNPSRMAGRSTYRY